jgi:hypothetical protein
MRIFPPRPPSRTAPALPDLFGSLAATCLAVVGGPAAGVLAVAVYLCFRTWATSRWTF